MVTRDNSVRSRPKVLVVEDEAIIAMMLEDMLLDADCEVAGVAQNLKSGLDLAQSADIDLAILDMSLGQDSSFPLADVLMRRGIPFMFASGFGTHALPEEHRERHVLNKPFHFAELVRSVELVLQQSLARQGTP
jgi:DNA-binding response OmpR family regulator